MLAERLAYYTKNKGDLPILRKHKYKTEKEYKEEYKWLQFVDSQALQQARRNLESAYTRFFHKRTKAPRFHRKKNEGSYRTLSKHIRIDWASMMINVPLIKWVKFQDGRSKIDGNIKSVTISRTPTDGTFKLKIGETKIALTREEADRLYGELYKALGKQHVYVNYPVQYHVNPVYHAPRYIEPYKVGDSPPCLAITCKCP
jgi:hypothetical protein